MKMKYLAILVVGSLIFFSFGVIQDKYIVGFDSYHELRAATGGGSNIEGLPEGENSVFSGSGKCGGCHGFDPTGYAGVDLDGNDVNLVDDWRASMMANSAKDPFWRAKVSHEVAINPDHQVELEDKCLSCHAPHGRHAAIYDGAEAYSMAEMLVDTLALDGVSCGSCHQQDPETVGTLFSGDMDFKVDTVYGPYGNGEDEPLFSSPMIGLVGTTPLYDQSISESEVCASCHTLITNTVDLDGNYTGGSFVEQATYDEWQNSDYDSPGGQECQACHFPRIEDPVVLSTNYIFLQGRSPFGLHTMVGGNSFMLEMMKNHSEELDAAASDEQFQSAIDATISQLQNASVDLVLTEVDLDDDSIYYEVSLTNLAGHKFPSGYPARRAFIEFTAYDEDGDLFFNSGLLQEDFEVEGQNETYEHHYDMINNADDVQIYELVLGDVNGDVTTVLERADYALKDNRLVPLGFSYEHENIDTTYVAGLALEDDDFNNNGTVGSGTDWVNYHIPLNGYEGNLTVSAKLYYQSAPPKWNEEMFAVSTPEIDMFEEWYWEQGPTPVLVDSDEITSYTVGMEENDLLETMVYPNPTMDGKIFLATNKLKMNQISVFDANGKLIEDILNLNVRTYELQLPSTKGLYHIVITSDDIRSMQRVIRN